MSASKAVLSVVIPHSQEAVLTEEWCLAELKGIDSEIIVAPTWKDGYSRVNGEFVSFIDHDCVLSPGYFKKLLSVFKDNPTYRKLAMVTPVLGVNSWDIKVFGYILSPTSIFPSRIRSSSDVYLIQIGYIPGAIIRRSALETASPIDGDHIIDSVNQSIRLWNKGQRIAIDPSVTYVSTNAELDLPFNVDRAVDAELEATIAMWKREMIG